MSVRLPRLLDANLNEIGRLRPSRLQADINMTPLSRATMSLPSGEPDVPMRAFIEIYNSQGSLGVYRVSSSVPDYGKGQTIGLKHGLTVLADATTGDEKTIDGSVRQVVGNLLACQTQKVGSTPFWSLGHVDVPDNVNVSVSGERANVLQTLLNVLKLPGINGRYMYTFDQSSFPWVINVAALKDEDASEARLGRNLTDISPTYDDSELATRVYAEGLTNGYMDTASPFGVVATKLDVPDGVNVDEYAREYLDINKEPRSQIKLDAQELFRLTGDSLDRFCTGHMCRVPLPAYDTILHFRVVTLTYDDLMSDPENVTVEMSNARDDTSYRLASQSSKISSNAGSISRNSSRILQQGVDLRKTQEDLIELDGSVARRFNDVGITLNEQDAKLNLFASQTIETIDGLRTRISSAEITLDGANARIIEEAKRIDTLTGEISTAKLELDGANKRITAIAGTVDDQGKLINGVQLDLDGAKAQIALKANQTTVDALAERTSSAEIEINGMRGQIKLKADQNTVDALTERVNAAEIDIDAANASIALKASQETLDKVTDRVTKAESTLTIQAGQIESKVSKDGVISSINQTPESVTISASKINLSGYVTASKFSAEIATINNMLTGKTQITTAAINTARVSNLAAANLEVNGFAATWKGFNIVNSFTQASGESAETEHIYLLSRNVDPSVKHTVAAGETKTFLYGA